MDKGADKTGAWRFFDLQNPMLPISIPTTQKNQNFHKETKGCAPQLSEIDNCYLFFGKAHFDCSVNSALGYDGKSAASDFYRP